MDTRLSLNGQWEFRKTIEEGWLPGQVPGSLFLDLMENKIMSDLYKNLNAADSLLFENNDYIYRKKFMVDNIPATPFLVFEGIDTIAEVFLNETSIGKCNNMFIRYKFSVDDVLKKGENLLEIIFTSPSRYAKTAYDNDSYKYKTCFEASRVFIRKSQYSFGWDWCPRFVSLGVWRDVYIEFVETAKLESPGISAFSIDNDIAATNIVFEIDVVKSGIFDIKCEAFFDGKLTGASVGKHRLDIGKHGINIPIEISQPQLWYPREIGDQNLYNFKISCKSESGSVSELDFVSGLRKVDVIQEKDDIGTSFQIAVNGIPMYAKGGNYIPSQMFPASETSAGRKKMVTLAAEANMNILRMWGGGYYEAHDFYEECDRQGILVWHDFMFSCGEYPDKYEWFRGLVKDEVNFVLKELRRHASIGLWCGSNENLWALADWWPDSDDKEFLGRKIYYEIMPQAVERFSPMTPYWESSPYGGDNPNDVRYGDSHYWGVWGDWDKIPSYEENVPRFASEFGLQGMAHLKTIEQHESKEYQVFPSVQTDMRNGGGEGNDKIHRYIMDLYGLPKDFKSFALLGQFVQGEAIKKASEHYRRNNHINSGIIFWQFNDCWPSPSFSCIDVHKRKKGLYYYAKRFYNQILCSVKNDENGITVHLINDFKQNVHGIFRLKVYDFLGNIKGIFEKAIISPHKKNKEISFSYNDLGLTDDTLVPFYEAQYNLNIHKFIKKECLETIVFVEFEYSEPVSGRSAISKNSFTFVRPRDLRLKPVDIRLEKKQDKIILSAGKPVLGVYIDTQNDCELSDNFFSIEPGTEHTVDVSGSPGKISLLQVAEMLQFYN